MQIDSIEVERRRVFLRMEIDQLDSLHERISGLIDAVQSAVNRAPETDEQVRQRNWRMLVTLQHQIDRRLKVFAVKEEFFFGEYGIACDAHCKPPLLRVNGAYPLTGLTMA